MNADRAFRRQRRRRWAPAPRSPARSARRRRRRRAPGGGRALAARRAVPFEGAHQAGVLTPRQPHAIVVAFDAIAASPAELAEGLRRLSVRAPRADRAATTLLGAPGEGPTPDSGILGPRVTPDGADGHDRRRRVAVRRPLRAGRAPAARPEADAGVPRRRARARREPRRRPRAAVRQHARRSSSRAARPDARDARRARRRAGRSRASCRAPARPRRRPQPARLQGRHRQPRRRRRAADGPAASGTPSGGTLRRSCASSATASSSGTASRAPSRS